MTRLEETDSFQGARFDSRRITQLEEVLHDLICRLGLFQEELARVKSQLAQAERGSRSEAEFASFYEKL